GQWFLRASTSSDFDILDRPSMPISLARSMSSSLVRSSYDSPSPPLRPVCDRDDAAEELAIRAAFSLLSPWRRSASYCSSSLTLGPWSLAMSRLLLGPGVPDAPRWCAGQPN